MRMMMIFMDDEGMRGRQNLSIYGADATATDMGIG